MKNIASVESDISKQSAFHCVGLGFKLSFQERGFRNGVSAFDARPFSLSHTQ